MGATENIDEYQDKETVVQEILKESVQEEINEILDNRSQYIPVPNVSEVTENLILCSAFCVNRKLLDMLNITCIVNAAQELPYLPPDNCSIKYHKVPIMDTCSSDIYQHFDEVADIIHKTACNGNKTLIFCVAGVSRSASLCLAYLMKHCNLSLLNAYNYLKKRRPRIKPNCGFFRQLIKYEEELRGCRSVDMIFNEMVQMEIPCVYDCYYKFVSDFRKNKEQDKKARN